MQHDSNSTRRQFFAHVTALGVAGLVGGRSFDLVSSPSAAAARPSIALELLTASDFQKHVGETFRIGQDQSETICAELVQVRLLTAAHASPGQTRAPFSLLFRVDGEKPLPHQIYPVEHAQMGRYDLFLGSVGSSMSQIKLEAIFS